ncbi:hypothetical protein IAU59_000237 [Kwoniella sp. CBS 9459]
MSSSAQTSTSTSTSTSTLSRSTLSSDITQLLHLKSSSSGSASAALDELLDSSPGKASQRDILPSTTAADTPAEVLKSFSFSLANKNPTSSDAPSQTQAQTTHMNEHEQSQRLVRAYISSMEDMKRLQASGQVDGVGQRIDKLRESAEGISSVLGEVRV